jgi:transcription initiation factor TFIIB
MNSTDRALINGFKEIQSMADRINIQKCIVDKAKANFKEVYENKAVGKDGEKANVQSLRGRSNDAIAAACLYIACRQENVPRTFKEICAISKVSKREIGRCFKLILKKMEKSVTVITSEDFMTRFCSSLQLPKHVQVASTFIAKVCSINGHTRVI